MMIGMSGGEDTVGGAGGGGVGDGGRGAAAFAFGTGSGVAGVVLRLGMVVGSGCVDSSFVGGGGSMPWPGCGFTATGRATEMSSGEAPELDEATGAGAFRLITLGGELTPDTKGSGSSLCTTVPLEDDAGAGAGGGEDGSGGGVDSPSISSWLSFESERCFFTSCDSVRVMWIIGGGGDWIGTSACGGGDMIVGGDRMPRLD
uniref:Putative glycine-rich cell wall structural protein n=1 Tax=Anopheles marajoara TaxID=58244 RepID=A0A2M4C000_9DIPT